MLADRRRQQPGKAGSAAATWWPCLCALRAAGRNSMTAPSVLGPLAAFVLILALIPAALWLLKRTPLGAAASSSPVRLVGALPLAANQRIVTVEVGAGDDRRWLVLGVTPAGIHTLHTLPPQASAPVAPGAARPLFAQLLARQPQRAAADAASASAAAPAGASDAH